MQVIEFLALPFYMAATPQIGLKCDEEDEAELVFVAWCRASATTNDYFTVRLHPHCGDIKFVWADAHALNLETHFEAKTKASSVDRIDCTFSNLTDLNLDLSAVLDVNSFFKILNSGWAKEVQRKRASQAARNNNPPPKECNHYVLKGHDCYVEFLSENCPEFIIEDRVA